jgi:hypothetical protein
MDLVSEDGCVLVLEYEFPPDFPSIARLEGEQDTVKIMHTLGAGDSYGPGVGGWLCAGPGVRVST